MRIDPKAVIGGYPALMIRKLVRKLNNIQYWKAETVQVILRNERSEAEAIIKTLVEAGLAVAAPIRVMDGWATTQFARSFGSATAAKPITRKTADHALSQLLERVNQVNTEARFLAKVTKLVVLGSYLRADVDRLSDLDIAVELQPKEANWDRLRELILKRVEQLEIAGRRFNWIEIEYWWHLEAFRFLKSRSRAISLIDYTAEKKFVDSVPHLALRSVASEVTPAADKAKVPARRRRRPSDCPF
ncbi:MAG: nucleotidyltransferase domain-containing protein [Bryobacteraceae bacterium]